MKMMRRMNEQPWKYWGVPVLLGLSLLSLSCPEGFWMGVPDSLTEKSWILTEFGTQDNMQVPIGSTKITLNFEQGKWSLGGTSGCNLYGAQYSLNGGSIRIQDIMSTEMYCTDPEGIMDQESVYVSILAEVRNWEVDNGRLYLWNRSGSRLEFRADTDSFRKK